MMMEDVIRNIKNNDYVEWLNSRVIQNPTHITFTLKQTYNGFNEFGVNINTYINQYLSSQNFQHFTNLLNYEIYKNGFLRYGKKLKMIVVNELSINNRLHIHSIIQKPNHLSNTKFEGLVKDKWSKTNFGYKEIDFQYPNNKNDRDGWVRYILKNNHLYHHNFDTIDLINTNF